jgi:hypothetical protein
VTKALTPILIHRESAWTFFEISRYNPDLRIRRSNHQPGFG